MKTCPFCAEQIQDDAIVCRFCDYTVTDIASRPRSRIPLPGALWYLAIPVVFGIGWLAGSHFGSRPSATKVVEATHGAAPAGQLTRDTFDAITLGMSYEDVYSIIGSPGRETNREGGNVVTSRYVWSSEDGRAIGATFVDGALTSKSKVGID